MSKARNSNESCSHIYNIYTLVVGDDANESSSHILQNVQWYAHGLLSGRNPPIALGADDHVSGIGAVLEQ